MKSLHRWLLISLATIFLWSAINPHDYFTWFLEVLPVLIAVPILFATYRRFPLTDLAYGLIWIHAIILIVGGHYTYAQMPLFNWLRDALGWHRNYYDRLGHFAQGFIPAIVMREILLRTSPLKKSRWLPFLVVCVVLAISATYEFFEWGAAIATGTRAEAFLGTQGDIWDTQWDMLCALIGGIIAMLTLTRAHDRSLELLQKSYLRASNAQ